ncbi:hypothetical protein Xkhy_09795 [Xanthomonas axonopodis pv. khayae]|nr:hypothetical protein Xkhy_09795 [Xanthomonas axonopodis pv. khayae]
MCCSSRHASSDGITSLAAVSPRQDALVHDMAGFHRHDGVHGQHAFTAGAPLAPGAARPALVPLAAPLRWHRPGSHAPAVT